MSTLAKKYKIWTRHVSAHQMSALLSVKHWNLSNLCGLGDKILSLLVMILMIVWKMSQLVCLTISVKEFPPSYLSYMFAELSKYSVFADAKISWTYTFYSLSFLPFFFSVIKCNKETWLEIGNRNKNLSTLVSKWAVISLFWKKCVLQKLILISHSCCCLGGSACFPSMSPNLLFARWQAYACAVVQVMLFYWIIRLLNFCCSTEMKNQIGRCTLLTWGTRGATI